MSASIQTVAALLIVAVASVWLVIAAIRRHRSPGCGGEACGMVSADARALVKKLKKG